VRKYLSTADHAAVVVGRLLQFQLAEDLSHIRDFN
jgi:hypothetical protein